MYEYRSTWQAEYLERNGKYFVATSEIQMKCYIVFYHGNNGEDTMPPESMASSCTFLIHHLPRYSQV